MTEDKFITLSQDIYLNETPKDMKLFSLKMRICSYHLSFETDSTPFNFLSNSRINLKSMYSP